MALKTVEDVDTSLASIAGHARTTVEESIVSAFAEMRELAAESAARIAETGTDDWGEHWKRDVLDRRPLYVMAIVEESGLHLWVTEPPTPCATSLFSGSVLHADVHHRVRDKETGRDLGSAAVVNETKAHTDAALALGWLYREIHGEFPDPAPPLVTSPAD